MTTLNDLTYDTIKKYYNKLSKFGYVKYKDVAKIIVLMFITDILEVSDTFFIKEDDYKILLHTLSCLFGSTCLIDFPYNPTEDTLFGASNSISRLKISEYSAFRKSESESLRVEE